MAETTTQSPGAAAPSSPSTHKRGTLLTFILGAAGAIAVYVVFWLRNPQVVLDAADSPLTVCLSGGCLLFIAALTGFVVWMSGPATPIKSLTMAISIPGLIFAVDIGAGSAETDDSSAREGQYSVADPSEAPLRSTSFFDRVRLALAPVSAVERHEAMKVERREAAAAADVRRLTAAVTELAGSLPQDGGPEREQAVRKAQERLNDLSDSGITILADELMRAPEGAQLFGLETLEKRPNRLPPDLRPKIRELEEHSDNPEVRELATRAGRNIRPPDGPKPPIDRP